MENKTEIERKFLVKVLPNNLGTPVVYERYYLLRESGVEIRIQKKGDIYEFERKIEKDRLGYEGLVFEITKVEFDELKKLCGDSINRESYQVSDNPNISIKIYKGKYEGLIRAEVEFETNEKDEEFKPLEWMGQEITNTSLGRDSKLIDLTGLEFDKLLEEYK